MNNLVSYLKHWLVVWLGANPVISFFKLKWKNEVKKRFAGLFSMTSGEVNARVREILSGDTVVLELKGGPFIALHLLHLEAPRRGKKGKADEPFFYESWCFIRDLLIIKFVILSESL